MSIPTSCLIIEDIYSVANGIQERIISELGIPKERINCFSFVDDALEFLEDNAPQIIIIDLAMDSVGLPKEDQINARNSRLTGWVFLKKYVFEGSYKKKLEDTHCYIVSGYGKIFSAELGISNPNNRININAINKKLAQMRNNLHFIPKSGADGGAQMLIQTIKKHSQNLLQ